MAISNRERVGKALDLLCAGLVPFVERELRQSTATSGRKSPAKANLRSAGNGRQAELHEAPLGHPGPAGRHVEPVEHGLQPHARPGRAELCQRTPRRAQQVGAPGGFRQQRCLPCPGQHGAFAHGRFGARGAEDRADADGSAAACSSMNNGGSEMRKASFVATEGKPQGGLKPWREVVTPHPDVASGRYQQAEFAADLWQVYQNEGSDEYKHPTEFFRRTFITEGLKGLLTRGLAAAGRGRAAIRSSNCRPTSAAARRTRTGAVAHVFRHARQRNARRRGTGQGSGRAVASRACIERCWSARRFLRASRTRSPMARWSGPSGASWHGNWAAKRATSWSRKPTKRRPIPAMPSRTCSTSMPPA